MRDLEARDNWIAARIDELLADDDWTDEQFDFYKEDDSDDSWLEFSTAAAAKQAEREHAAIMSDLEDERINLHRGDYE